MPPTQAVEAEAARLEACRAQAQEIRIEAQLRLGRHEAVLGELETLVAAHPLREGLRGKLMLALHRSGRRDDALAAYRDLRHVLIEELGVEPSPSLQELERQILNADAELLAKSAPADGRANAAPQSSEAKPRQLPHANTTFIGRDSEIAVLRQLLGDGDREAVAISTIHGTGGVGKSALTLHVAHRLADRFPDGQLYVDLHGVTEGLSPVAPGEVLCRFLTALGVERTAVPDNVDEAASMFRSLVADRRLLVVLDNAANVEQVRPLLPAGEGCAALITSREILATLEGATHMYLGVLFHDQATALLKQMVGAERVEAEPEAVDALIQMCGGLPLALRIIGARLAARPGWTLRSFTDRLADTQNRLDELRVGDLTVRASFHASYEASATASVPSTSTRRARSGSSGWCPGRT